EGRAAESKTTSRCDFDKLHVGENEFCYGFGWSNAYQETIDSTNLMQHLEYLGERATFKELILVNVNWEMFANCKFACEEFIRPTHKLELHLRATFFTNNYAVGLQEVRLTGWGNAMVDPLNDSILLDLYLLRFHRRQIDEIDLRAVGGEAEFQNFLHNLSGLQDAVLESA
ncbi:unnamed protein product, partial [Mesorhabditis belari]|uniref:Uncharacterized protein n=1 Tax=Mesorhabditis belari TaxID=2138241 RepID=A0AAF3EHL2_9BILA